MAQKRRIVFFLGAGASVAVGAYANVQGGGQLRIPTQSDFWSTFLKFCRSAENKRTIESFLFRYFLGYKKPPNRSKSSDRWHALDRLDVEEVFTFLSERISAPTTTTQLRTAAQKVWDALVSEIGNVFSRFEPNKNTRKMFLEFMDQHVRSWDTIVSFNYDTVFENSVSKKKALFYEGLRERRRHAIRVIKPHGSINWQATEAGLEVVASPEHCVVVAPTHLKFVINNRVENPEQDGAFGYLNQTDVLSKIWECMEAQMRTAKALVFVGYSFPVADLYLSSVIRTVLSLRDSQPRVVIVNPDAVAIRTKLAARFALDEIEAFYDFGQFIQTSREELF